MKQRAAIAATLYVTAWSLAAAQAPVAATSTLLVPRPGALEFVDPGSGLLLASVALDTAPRRVAVSPDGRLAAVLGCRATAPGSTGPVALSIVGLERPRELRRIDLGARSCPPSLQWGTADRANWIVAAGDPAIVVNTDQGQVLPADVAVGIAPAANRSRHAGEAEASSAAVQRVLAEGGRLEDLAVSPIIPRAVCHACSTERNDF